MCIYTSTTSRSLVVAVWVWYSDDGDIFSPLPSWPHDDLKAFANLGNWSVTITANIKFRKSLVMIKVNLEPRTSEPASVSHETTLTEVNIENSDIKVISISVTLLFEHIYCFTAWGSGRCMINQTTRSYDLNVTCYSNGSLHFHSLGKQVWV